MSSKKIFQDSLNHKSGNKIPIDFGSTAVTGMHVNCIDGLLKYYGIKKDPVKVIEPYQMLGEINDELKEIIGIDTVGVFTKKNMFGFENKNWKEWKLPNGLLVQVPGDFKVTKNDSGGFLIYPKGDLTATPSARMPSDGWFFDTIIRQEPIIEDKLDPEDNLEEFELINDEDLDFYEKECKKAFETDKAVVATFGGTAFGDIALVPAPFLKNPKGIRDIQEWYISTIMRPDYIHSIFEKQSEIALANLTKLNERAGKFIDVLFICGTDFGTQNSTFCSIDDYNELYKPYYQRINNWIHKNTNWKTFKHSCGAVENFMEGFIDSGFDIINPVQCTAAGMEPEILKEKYGDKLVFWGGGTDTQTILSFGTPEEVREQILSRCEILGKDGGFVFNSVHNIQATTPIENIVAMIDALKEINK
ncbi:MAG: hypothetical protein JEY94_01505 [Melioribacteraceae bacterium]|nr:hypothetical protein [Melioribacteraceae bacterium]